MSKVIVIGGGAAGAMAAVTAAKEAVKQSFLKKMRKLERRFLSREKADAM